jgi:hypothetical protein
MAVQGSLATMSVPEVLQWIAQGRKTGTLFLSTTKGDLQIAFDGGLLIFSSSPDPEQTLGRLLIRKGVITEAAHEQALQIRRDHSIAVAKVLTELNLVPEREILHHLRMKAEDEIYSIFLCEEGEFRFEPRELPTLELLPLRLDVTKAVVKVCQRLDEGEEFDFDSSWTSRPS